MTRFALSLRTSDVLVVSLALWGCSNAHVGDVPPARPGPIEPAPVEPAPVEPAPVEPAPVPATLSGCVLAGGELVVRAVVDNNDQANHGSITSLALAEDGTLAVASSYGTLKFWRVEARALEGTVDTRVVTYGPEGPAAEIHDIEQVRGRGFVGGDTQGVVAAYTPDGLEGVVGGTAPGTAIVSVAVDTVRRRIAHVDAAGSIMVRGLDDSFVAGPLDRFAPSIGSRETPLTPHDVAFDADGHLWGVVGDGLVAVFRWSAPDFASAVLVDALWTNIEGGAVSFAGRTGVARVGGTAFWLDADGTSQPVVGAAPGAIALTPDGAILLAEAGDEVYAWNREQPITSIDLGARARILRTDPNGEFAVAVTGSSSIHVIECEP